MFALYDFEDSFSQTKCAGDWLWPEMALLANSQTHPRSGARACSGGRRFKGFKKVFSFESSSLARHLVCCVLLRLHMNVHILKHEFYGATGAFFPCVVPMIAPVPYSNPWVASLGTKTLYVVGMCSLACPFNYFSDCRPAESQPSVCIHMLTQRLAAPARASGSEFKSPSFYREPDGLFLVALSHTVDPCSYQSVGCRNVPNTKWRSRAQGGEDRALSFPVMCEVAAGWP